MPQLPAEDATVQHKRVASSRGLSAFCMIGLVEQPRKSRFPACYLEGGARLAFGKKQCHRATRSEELRCGGVRRMGDLRRLGMASSWHLERTSLRAFLKLICGTVLDVNQIGVQNSEGHWETPPNTERSLQLDHRLSLEVDPSAIPSSCFCAHGGSCGAFRRCQSRRWMRLPPVPSANPSRNTQ